MNKVMPDVHRYSTKPCDVCGKRIQGGNWHCPKCKICFCYYCGTQLILKGLAGWPLQCPICGEKLKQ